MIIWSYLFLGFGIVLLGLVSVCPNGVISNPNYFPGTSHNGGYNHETAVHAIRECGYRLIDTAKRYGTEPLVARAIEDAGVDRPDILYLKHAGLGKLL